ncbi:MAG: branched-chain amino acid aminotransferase [Acidobacteria bacterium]|nr:branched-chain amino acid aminotransferase [Acidobacteriota bacterium]
MVDRSTLEQAVKAPFGKVLADQMALARFENGAWSDFEIVPTGPIPMSPACHVFHYASTCFEGLKAHRWPDGSVHIFRLERHMQRLENSADLLCLPKVGVERSTEMVKAIVAANRDWVPDPPGSLYIRPTLIGTDHSIGAATTPSANALFFILVSPVGDYFKNGPKPLKIALETEQYRTSPHFGAVKTGGNYAACLKKITDLKKHQDLDNVLFAPHGDVQETGAANFLLINDHKIVTKKLDGSFLPGVTRESILMLAREMGYQIEERMVTVDEVFEWAKTGEAVLSGTAAVLATVGSITYQGETHTFRDGMEGPNTVKLRSALIEIQRGQRPDPFQWTLPV